MAEYEDNDAKGSKKDAYAALELGDLAESISQREEQIRLAVESGAPGAEGAEKLVKMYLARRKMLFEHAANQAGSEPRDQTPKKEKSSQDSDCSASTTHGKSRTIKSSPEERQLTTKPASQAISSRQSLHRDVCNGCKFCAFVEDQLEKCKQDQLELDRKDQELAHERRLSRASLSSRISSASDALDSSPSRIRSRSFSERSWARPRSEKAPSRHTIESAEAASTRRPRHHSFETDFASLVSPHTESVHSQLSLSTPASTSRRYAMDAPISASQQRPRRASFDNFIQGYGNDFTGEKQPAWESGSSSFKTRDVFKVPTKYWDGPQISKSSNADIVSRVKNAHADQGHKNRITASAPSGFFDLNSASSLSEVQHASRRKMQTQVSGSRASVRQKSERRASVESNQSALRRVSFESDQSMSRRVSVDSNQSVSRRGGRDRAAKNPRKESRSSRSSKRENVRDEDPLLVECVECQRWVPASVHQDSNLAIGYCCSNVLVSRLDTRVPSV